ncbi:MAG: CPBP family intramembrane metalloprotease [Clostridium sp.]|nr:CPBP family intramembrane metalloprotease [Clostridium sp.]
MVSNFEDEVYLRKLKLKENIKKSAGKCTKMLLILSMSTYIFGMIITFILRFRAKKLGIESDLDAGIILGVSNDAYTFLMGYLPCILGDILAIFIGLKSTKLKIKRDLLTQNESSKSFMLLGCFSSIAVGFISSIVYLIYSTIIEANGITIPSPDFSLPTEAKYITLFILYTCVIAPICEEIIFRGIILSSMKKYGNLTAIMVSSILFSMFHFNLVQFINPVLMGIMFGFIALKSKSIKPCIVVHMFNNSLIMVTMLISKSNMPLLESLFNMLYFFGGLIGFIVFVYKYKNEFFNIIREKSILIKTHKKIAYSFSGFWSIAYIIFYVIVVIGTMVLTNILNITN